MILVGSYERQPSLDILGGCFRKVRLLYRNILIGAQLWLVLKLSSATIDYRHLTTVIIRRLTESLCPQTEIF